MVYVVVVIRYGTSYYIVLAARASLVCAVCLQVGWGRQLGGHVSWGGDVRLTRVLASTLIFHAD